MAVKNNIEIAQEKQKENYDRKHTVVGSFSSGALVLKKDFTRKRRRGGALDFRWLGPYTITNSLGKGLYRLVHQQTGTVVNRVNGFHLKPYHAHLEHENGADDVDLVADAHDLEREDGADDVELKSGDEVVDLVDDVDIVDEVDHADVAELKDDEIKDGHWLSCDVINRAQSLLKKRFPDQNGLQSGCCFGSGGGYLVGGQIRHDRTVKRQACRDCTRPG